MLKAHKSGSGGLGVKVAQLPKEALSRLSRASHQRKGEGLSWVCNHGAEVHDGNWEDSIPGGRAWESQGQGAG